MPNCERAYCEQKPCKYFVFTMLLAQLGEYLFTGFPLGEELALKITKVDSRRGTQFHRN
jgi:hypothetical protein